MAESDLEKYVFNDIDTLMAKKFGERYLSYRRSFSTPHLEPLMLPLHLDIDVSDACNLSCAFCHQKYRKRSGIKIKIKYIKKAISESSTILSAVNVGASCEPLLEKKLIEETFLLCNEYNVMDTFLHTNALLLDKSTSKFLIDVGLKHICISIDASSKMTYKSMRSSNDYDLLMDNIFNFIELRGNNPFPQLRVSFCVTKMNYFEKNDFLGFWGNIADVVDFQQFRAVDGIDEDIYISQRERKKETKCGAGLIRGMLWPNGNISACCAGWEDVTFGNIRISHMKDIWNGEKANELRKILSSGKAALLPKVCQMCLAGRSAFSQQDT